MSYVRCLFSDCSPQSLRANNFQEVRLRRVSPLIAFIFQGLVVTQQCRTGTLYVVSFLPARGFGNRPRGFVCAMVAI